MFYTIIRFNPKRTLYRVRHVVDGGPVYDWIALAIWLTVAIFAVVAWLHSRV